MPELAQSGVDPFRALGIDTSQLDRLPAVPPTQGMLLAQQGSSGVDPFRALGIDPAIAAQSAPAKGALPDWAINDRPAPAASANARSNPLWFDRLPDAGGVVKAAPAPVSTTGGDGIPNVTVTAKGPPKDTSWFDQLPDAGAAGKLQAPIRQGGATAILDQLPSVSPPQGMLRAQQGGETPADKSSWSGIGNAIPSGLYSGVASMANAPTALWNLGAAGVRAIGGPDVSLNPPINQNPMNYQPRGAAERAIHAGAEAVGSLPSMAVGGEIAAPLLRAGGQLAGRAVSPAVAPFVQGAANTAANVVQSFTEMPMNSPGMATAAGNVARFAPAPMRPAIAAMGEGASKLPVGVVPQSAFAGAAGGQAASENVPDQWKPTVNVAGNLLFGGGLAAAETLAAKGGRLAAGALGGAGIGPKSAVLDANGQPLVGSNGKPLRATETQRNIIAGQLSKAAGPDLDAARGALNNAPDELVPGSASTTAQVAPVPGFVGLQQAHRVATPEPFNARLASQNSARLGLIQGLAPGDADPAAVGNWFRSQLAAADQAGQIGLAARQGDVGAQIEALGGRGTPEGYAGPVQAAVDTAQAPLRAQAAADVTGAQAARGGALGALPGGRRAVPGGATVPEQYGADIRGQAMQARAAESTHVNRLQGLIDPDGTAGVAAAPFRDAVEGVYAGRPAAEAAPSGEEAAIRGIARGWGNLTPLSEVFALRQRVGDAISNLLPPGSSATAPVRRLQQVKGALDDTLSNMAAHQAAFEAQEVQAGRMAPDGTMLGRLQSDAGSPHATPGTLGTATPGSSAVRNGQPAGAGTAGAAGVRGTAGGGEGRFGSAGSNRNVASPATAQGLGPKPESLVDFLISRGGVKDQGGDLKAIGADAVHHQQGGRLVNGRGVPLDYAREAAEQAGFLRPNSTTADLLNSIADEVSGRPQYRISEQADGDVRARNARESDRELAMYQLARSAVGMAESDAGARLSNEEIDHAARLAMGGMHPQQAIMEAVRTREDVELGRNAQAGVFAHPGMPAGAREAPLPLSGGAAASNLRPMTGEQLGHYKSYTTAAQSLKQRFDSGAVGDVLAFGEHRTSADVPSDISRARGGFQQPDAAVVGKILGKGVTEADATRQALAAGIKPETLTGALADELRARAVQPDGNVDLKAYRQFRRDHAGALHVFPETLAAFDSLAHAQETLSGAETRQSAVEAAHPLNGVASPAVMGRYWRPGDEGAEAVRQFGRDTGKDRASQAALDQFAVYRMRDEGVVSPDGRIDPKALDRYTARYARALAERPELARQLSSVRAAQGALDQASAAHEAALRDYENGAARNFLHDDPAVAVRRAFSSGNPADTFGRLVDMVHGSADAEAGLRRGVVDYILERARSATPAGEDEDFLRADVFRRFIRNNALPLRILFGRDGVQNLDLVAADLRRGSYSGVSASGSPTATYAAGVKRHNLIPGGHAGAGIGMSVLTLMGERIGEQIAGHGLAGAIALPAAGMALGALRQAGVRTLNDLERLAMLHPSVARELLARVGPDGTVGPMSQRRLGAAIQGILGAGAVQQISRAGAA